MAETLTDFNSIQRAFRGACIDSRVLLQEIPASVRVALLVSSPGGPPANTAKNPLSLSQLDLAGISAFEGSAQISPFGVDLALRGARDR